MPGHATLANWLRLTLTPGIGGETQRKLLGAFGLPDLIFSAGRGALRGVVGDRLADLLLDTDNRAAVNGALAWAEDQGHEIVTLGDTAYPTALLEIPDPPTLIYVRGRIELLQRPALAIVGSRNPTPQGIRNAESFAAALAEAGLIVTSGLALGIDAAAHRAALDVSGGTVAFIGTGIDRIYPARNRDLALRISEVGCVVSEFPLGTPAAAHNFPRRNRLISGFSRGVLVVEAAVESGSLITARLAGEQGREVFAIPGSIHAAQSRGCHKLIRQGAKLVETVQDILDELSWVSTGKTPVSVSAATPDDSILALIGFDPCSLDDLSERAGLSIATLSPRLLQLELEGRLASLPGGRIQRLSKA